MNNAAFSALLTRLDFPDRIVRLIAAREISRLLNAGNQTSNLAHFFRWLNSRELEADVVTGLSVLSLSWSAMECDEIRVLQNIKRPSILSDILLEKMFSRAMRITTWSNAHSGFAPATFKTPDKFISMVSQAGPILLSFFQNVEKKHGIPMVKQWAWELEALQNRGFETEFSLSYFVDRSDCEDNGSFEPRAADVIRSSFLRTLSFAVSVCDLPEDIARYFASHCIPLFPDLAFVDFGSAPKMWGAGGNISDDRLMEFLHACGECAEEVVIAANGRWHTSNQHLAKVSVIGALVPVGTKLDVGEISSQLDIFHAGALLNESLGVSGSVQEFPDLQTARKASLIPLAFKFCPNFVPRWQIDILLNHFFWPFPVLGEMIEARCCAEGVKFSKSEEDIATWYFWLQDWEPGYPGFAGPRLGAALTIKRHIINFWVKETGLKLILYGHAKSWTRETTYGEFHKTEFWGQQEF